MATIYSASPTTWSDMERTRSAAPVLDDELLMWATENARETIAGLMQPSGARG